MNTEEQKSHSLAAVPRVLSIKAFGIGTAGVNLLDRLAAEGIAADSLIAVHSDTNALAASSAAEKIKIECKQPGNSAAPLFPERNVSQGAEEQVPRIKSLCSGTDVVLTIAGLGGGVGTELCGLVAGIAREAGAFSLSVAILPFECEGSLRAQVAMSGLKRLREAADLVFVWSNQKTLSLIDESTSLLATFDSSNRLLARSLLTAWKAFTSRTALGLSFFDLCGAMMRQSRECVFAISEATGPNRSAEALEKLVAHPMLSAATAAGVSESMLAQAESVAVWVLGGASLGMVEVNRVMDQLQRQCESASVLMGAAIKSELPDTLVLGLMLAAPEERSANQTEIVDEEATDPNRTGELQIELLENTPTARPSRFVPPPPALPREKMAELLKEQTRGAGRGKKLQAKLRQTQLPLEIISKGRFDKSEPTIHKGEDLDIPTYIRRGVALN